jgi:hypothetical protein
VRSLSTKKVLAEICDKKCRVNVSQIFEFVELILFFKTYLGGGLAPSSQTVGSLLYSLASKTDQKNDVSITQIESTKSKICEIVVKLETGRQSIIK